MLRDALMSRLRRRRDGELSDEEDANVESGHGQGVAPSSSSSTSDAGESKSAAAAGDGATAAGGTGAVKKQRTKPSLEERYTASMVLAGVGDAMGYRRGTFEFCRDGERIHNDVMKVVFTTTL